MVAVVYSSSEQRHAGMCSAAGAEQRWHYGRCTAIRMWQGSAPSDSRLLFIRVKPVFGRTAESPPCCSELYHSYADLMLYAGQVQHHLP